MKVLRHRTIPTVLIGTCMLTACVTDNATRNDQVANPNEAQQVSQNLNVSQGVQTRPSQLQNRLQPQPIIDYGTGEFFERSISPVPSSAGGGDTLIFRDAPIDAVINEVLGERYGLNYIIDQNVTGTLSLRLEGIDSPREAISGLNAALGLQGFELARSGDTYVARRIGRADTSVAPLTFVGPDAPLDPDAGAAIIKLRYANTSEVAEIVQSILPEATIRFDDDARGLIILTGEPELVYQASGLVRSLDVNWLSAVSTAIIPITAASPLDIVAEAEPIFSRLGGVSIVPLERLDSLLVMSRTREGLVQARSWIAKLDRSAGPKFTRDLMIFEARHADAADLVALAQGNGTSSSTSQRSSSDSSDQIGSAIISSPQGGNNLFGSLSVQVDDSQNSIIARGEKADLQSLSELLTALDRPKRQVLIEATIIEVSLNDSRSLGVQWDAVEAQLAATLSDTTSGQVTSLFPGVSVSYINRDVSAVVNALASTSEVEVISSPRMLVLNNQTARLQIGDQVPIITQSAVSISDPGAPVVNSTTYRDTGIILTVTPSVRAGGMVEVEIAQEVSGVAETTTSNIDSPTITQRSLESVLAVPDGATAVLGGLMSSTRSVSNSGIPVLKDIPYLGAAFRSDSETLRRTELIILIEPTVVQGDAPLLNVPERLREALRRVRDE